MSKDWVNNETLAIFLFIYGLLLDPVLLKLSMRLSEACRGEDEEFSIESVKALERGKIKWRIGVGVMFGLMGYIVGWNPELIVYLLFGATLITGLYSDILTMAVPTVILTAGAGLILLTRLFIGVNLMSYLVAAGFFYLCFYILHIFSKEGFGGADVEIIGVMFLAFGTSDAIRMIYLSCGIALVEFAGKLALTRVRGGERLGKESLKDKKPFYPYLTYGVILFLILLAK